MSSTSFFDANGTLGALSIGALVSTFLFGICTLQVYIYFVNFPEDRWAFKSLVSAVWLLEFGHCICVCHFVYTWTITAYGNPSVLASRPPLSISTTVLLGAFIAQSVQMFFADRVRVVSEGRLLIASICGLASGGLFGIEIFVYVKAVQTTSLQAFETNCRSLIMVGLCLNAAIDLAEALSLCYYLRKLQLQSLKRTSIRIHAIMKLTMETGLLKSLGELSVLLTFWYMLHSNSLLASLNSRMLIRHAGNVKPCDVERPASSWISPSKLAWSVDASPRSSEIGGSSSMLVQNRQH